MSQDAFSGSKSWPIALLLIVGVAVLAPSEVRAQTATEAPLAPVYTAVDANGVDLLSGNAMLYEKSLSIGDNAVGVTAVWDSSQTYSYEVSQSKLLFDPDAMTIAVSVGGRSEVFDAYSGGVYIPRVNEGSTLTRDSSQWSYTDHDGAVAHFTGFNPFVTNWQNQGVKTGFFTDSVAPTGERLTTSLTNVGFPLYLESSLGYAIAGGPQTRVAGNLRASGCDSNGCTTPTLQSSQALGRANTYDLPGSSTQNVTLVVHNPAGRANRSYVLRGYDRKVLSYSDGVGTWTYGYNDVCDTGYSGAGCPGIRTVTVTDPLAHTRVVTSRLGVGTILSDQDGAGKITVYGYDGDSYSRGSGHLTRVTRPEGDATWVELDARGNVTAQHHTPKPGSAEAETIIRAGYPATCDNPKTCNKPLWIKDARGDQTDYTYDPVHGGVLTVTGPVPASGAVRPQTRYTYGQFTAMYVRGGVLQAAAAPVWRLTQTSTCQTQGPAVGTTPAPCVGKADEVVTSYAYESSNVANNVRLLSTTTRSGDGSLSATTTYAYDDRGDVISTDGPLAGSADTTRTYYDASRWKIGEIGPDPDGTGALLYRASRTTYRADGLVTLSETGTATGQSDTAMSSFAPLAFTRSTYGPTGQLIKTEAGQP